MAIGRPVEAVADIPEAAPRRRWLAVVGEFCRQRPLGALGAAVVAVNILVGLGANVIAPYDPVATDYGAMLARPTTAHWLGTDAFGRDVLSRIIYGSRTAMLVGFACAFIGATVGAVIGVASAYFAGKVDLLVQRVMDIFLAFPLIILALAVVSILGTGIQNVIVAIAIPDDSARRARGAVERAWRSARCRTWTPRARPASGTGASFCATCSRT